MEKKEIIAIIIGILLFFLSLFGAVSKNSGIEVPVEEVEKELRKSGYAE